MTDKSLKNFSLAEIEACISKALTELTGSEVAVLINSIDHPPISEVARWAGDNGWKATFAVAAAKRVITPDFPD